jgi:hypothetical protein
MTDRWYQIGRLLSALATKRGVILSLVIIASALGAGLAFFQGGPVDDTAPGDEVTTTEGPDGGPAETSTVATEETESAPSRGTEDGEAKSDRGTPPQTQEGGVTEETTQTTSETTRTTSEGTETTTTTTTSDDGPDASVSGESNASASSLTRAGVGRRTQSWS